MQFRYNFNSVHLTSILTTTMRSFIGIFVIANAIYTAYTLCNTCSVETGLACVDNNSFKVCYDGLPYPPAISCPNGTVCSISSKKICINPNSSDAEPACNGCGTCNEDLTFACSTYNTFQLCLGTDTPNSEVYMCPTGLMCNTDSQTICVSQDSGIGSTCPWKTMTNTTLAPPVIPTVSPTTTPTTTISPSENPREYCAAKGVRGRYEINSDSTCSQFISCSQSGGVWTGSVYVCPAKRYFNPNTQVCGVELPERCQPQPEPETTTVEPSEICD